MSTTVSVEQQKQNLGNVFSSMPVKVGAVIFLLVIIVIGSLGVHKLRGGGEKAAAGPKLADFNAPTDAPAGAVDERAFKDKLRVDAEEAAKAEASGRSYFGNFTFVGERGGKRFESDKSGSADARAHDDPLKAIDAEVAANSRREAAALGLDRGGKAGASSAQQPTGAPPLSTDVASSTAAQPGSGARSDLTTAEVEALSKQLDKSASFKPMKYVSAVDAGEATRSPAATPSTTPAVASSTPASASAAKEEELIAGGEVCPVTMDNPINTDLMASVFVTIQGCGPLNGVRLRGSIVKGVDDFGITFDAAHPPRGYPYKFTAPIQAESVNLETGGAGIAQKVDKHWLERIATAGLVGLAKAEQQSLSARAQQSITNGTTITQSVDKYTAEERRNARIAGFAQEGLGVVAKDAALGVNRAPTMTTKRDTAIGVRFLGPVKGTKQ